jgi:hypothetical protein
MLKRLELQLCCLKLFNVTDDDDAQVISDLVNQVEATIETLKTGINKKLTDQEWWDSQPIIDGNKPKTNYDTNTPTGFLLGLKDVFEKMTLTEFATSGYCKIMEQKGWGDHYDVVEKFNEFYPRINPARLHQIHVESRARMKDKESIVAEAGRTASAAVQLMPSINVDVAEA